MFLPLLIAIHVIGVILWIGGVAFVTMVVFPMIMRLENSLEKVLFFQGIEHRFAKIAKTSVVVVGVTGVLLLQITGKWNIMFKASGVGPTLMAVVWLFYVLVLMFEGRLFKAIFSSEAQQDAAKVFYRLSVFHWVILGLSLLAVGVGVWAGHGGRF
ncbi:MAG: hypothetical protein HY035_04100 [Nitrospirae bacterium]|nr:hypothetical protein [Nitrospirota bacterium]MBI3377571.1 hypothetical protein [Nitrospirota bacterium]